MIDETLIEQASETSVGIDEMTYLGDGGATVCVVPRDGDQWETHLVSPRVHDRL